MKKLALWPALLIFGLLVTLNVSSAQAQPACVQPPPGTISWWSLDETSGTTAEDRVGDNPGAYANGPVPADGMVRSALRFDGRNDYVAVADSDLWAFGSNDFTIELWANFDAPGSGNIVRAGDIFIGNDEGPGLRNKWFFALGGGVLHFTVYNVDSPPSNFYLVRAPFYPNVGQWYHLAVTKSGTLFTIFVNGTPVGSEISTSPIANPNAPLTIGQAENLGYMNGRLDEIAIYHRALTQEELQAIYDAGSAGKCIDLDIRPDKGGDTGSVSVHINGTGFAQDATVKLARVGELDIVGAPVTVGDDGTTIDTTFELIGKAQGLWDVVVENPDETYFTLPEGFTIEEGQTTQLWVDIVGFNLIRPGREQTYWINYGNSGNVDVWGTRLFLGIPANVEFKLDRDGDFKNQSNSTVSHLLVSHIPAGSSSFIPLVLKTPLTANDFQIGIAISRKQQGFWHEHSQEYPQEYPLVPIDQYRLIQLPTWIDTPYADLPTGYVDIFLVKDEKGKIFPEAAIRIDGEVAWCYPGEDVHKRPFTDFNFDENGVGTVELKDGTTISVMHLFSIRPKRAEIDPQQIRDNYELYKDSKFWDFSRDDGPADPDNRYLSCIGFVLHLLFGENLPSLDGINPAFGEQNPDGTWSFDIEDVLGYWFWLNKLDVNSILGQLDEKMIESEFREWWEAYKKILKIRIVNAIDPNDKVGSQGAGEDHFLFGEEPLRYSIFFENLETATAPAQEIVITDQLDPVNMDLSTLSLGPITFGNNQVVPSPGLSNFATDVDLRPDNDLIVRIEVSLNPNTGLLTWRFTSIDPATGELPEDPLAGFLPPNINPPEGDGSVIFTVMPKEGLPTGTQILNQATIVFDVNTPIVTPKWLNTLDNTKPTSQVLPLAPTQSSTDFLVEWSGIDEGAGIRDYTVFVSEDGGDFIPFVERTPDTSGMFSGESGKTYEFFSIANDFVGNVETKEPIAEAVTTILEFYGDVSGDGHVTAYDASLVLQYVVWLIELLPDEQEAADVTGDGIISALDAALILQYTVGLITSFPADSPPAAPALNPLDETRLLAEAIEEFDTTPLTKEQKQVLEQLRNLVFKQLRKKGQ